MTFHSIPYTCYHDKHVWYWRVLSFKRVNMKLTTSSWSFSHLWTCNKFKTNFGSRKNRLAQTQIKFVKYIIVDNLLFRGLYVMILAKLHLTLTVKCLQAPPPSPNSFFYHTSPMSTVWRCMKHVGTCRIFSYTIHICFIYVSYMIHIWFIYVSYMFHIWILHVNEIKCIGFM